LFVELVYSVKKRLTAWKVGIDQVLLGESYIRPQLECLVGFAVDVTDELLLGLPIGISVGEALHLHHRRGLRSRWRISRRSLHRSRAPYRYST